MAKLSDSSKRKWNRDIQIAMIGVALGIMGQVIFSGFSFLFEFPYDVAFKIPNDLNFDNEILSLLAGIVAFMVIFKIANGFELLRQLRRTE